MTERGAIRNRNYRAQVADMSGLRWGNITPTDIDAFLDFGDRIFVFIESKFKGTFFGGGQMLALERLCDASNNPPRRFAFALVVDHQTPPDQDIDYANTVVRTYRMDGKWRQPAQPGTTLRVAIDRLRAFVSNKTRPRSAT